MTHDRPPRQPALHGLVDVSHQPSAVESFVINFRPVTKSFNSQEVTGKKAYAGQMSHLNFGIFGSVGLQVDSKDGC